MSGVYNLHFWGEGNLCTSVLTRNVFKTLYWKEVSKWWDWLDPQFVRPNSSSVNELNILTFYLILILSTTLPRHLSWHEFRCLWHIALSFHLVGWISKLKRVAQWYLFPPVNIFVLYSKNCNISKKVEPKASVAEEWGQEKKIMEREFKKKKVLVLARQVVRQGQKYRGNKTDEGLQSENYLGIGCWER